MAATGVWRPQEGRKVMQLVGVEALAPALVRVKNLGAAEGGHEAAVAQLCAINRYIVCLCHAGSKHPPVKISVCRPAWPVGLSLMEMKSMPMRSLREMEC